MNVSSPGGDGPQQLHCPLSICVDGDGMIIVADYRNNRIQLLTPDLQLVRHLITGIKNPRLVCLDEISGCLFVGFEDGSVINFRVRPPLL
jgi:hypothetical protein